MMQEKKNPFSFFYMDSIARGRELMSYRYPHNVNDKTCDEQCLHDWSVYIYNPVVMEKNFLRPLLDLSIMHNF